MIQIALCEDDPVFRQSQQQLCEEVLQALGWETQLTIYSCGEDLLTDWEKGIRYNLLLLDIVMGEIDGIALARRLRVMQADAAIVFITSNPNFALQGYDVDALHYLMKPLERATLTEVLQKYHAKQTGNKKLCFTIGASTICENLNDILFLETKGREVAVVLKHKTLTLPGKLSDLLITFPANLFLRCHQGFAVNASQIQQMNGNFAILHNGASIPIGRTYKKEFRDAFLNQMGQ